MFLVVFLSLGGLTFDITDDGRRAPYSTWIYLAEGTFGKVFLVSDIYPPIEMDGERCDLSVLYR